MRYALVTGEAYKESNSRRCQEEEVGDGPILLAEKATSKKQVQCQWPSV